MERTGAGAKLDRARAGGPPLRSRLLWWLVRSGAERTGHDLVARDYYSPLPELERLADAWSTERELRGVDLRLAAAVELLTEMQEHLLEAGSALGAMQGFSLANGAYGSVDAEVLFAILRRAKPRRVVELGSGVSSHVIWSAQLANEADGSGFEHRIFDPHPFEANPIGPVVGPLVTPTRAQEVEDSEITALQQDDVLFVDTTHTVKTGGDVTRIVLDLLPQLAPGVLVHFHDVFLPHEYPRQWVVDERRAWAEQYLLHAFLAFNDRFEVVFPAHAVVREVPEVVARLVASFEPLVAPGAFWLRRVG